MFTDSSERFKWDWKEKAQDPLAHYIVITSCIQTIPSSPYPYGTPASLNLNLKLAHLLYILLRD